MRFRSEDIGDIRRGEKTLVHLPYEGKALRFKPGRDYALERVTDEREERVCKNCAGSGNITVYVTKAVALEGEAIRIVGVPERVLVANVTDEDALLEGFESAAEWRDAFECDHGEHAVVWRFEIEHVTDLPNLLAKHGDYTHSDFDAVEDEPEGVSKQTLRDFAVDNWERFRKSRPDASAEDESRRLERRMKELRKEAARTGRDVSPQIAKIEAELDDIERELREAA